jgi:hypothetical protein
MYDHKRAIAYSLWCAHSITVIKLPTMHICDLTNAKTLSALRADLSALMHNNLSAPQEWGLAIQQHPTNFQGIKFKSRFNGKACLALFNHDGIEKGLKETRTEPLANSEPAADWLDRYKVSLF